MPAFSENDIRCDFTNTLMDDIARSAYLQTFGLPDQPPRDQEGKVVEASQIGWTRTFCMIAAHAKHVSGIGDWQPPASAFDFTETELHASRAQFFAFFDKDEVGLVYRLAKALYDHLQGKNALVTPAEASSGDEEKDFLERKAATSTKGLSTRRRGASGAPSRSPT